MDRLVVGCLGRLCGLAGLQDFADRENKLCRLLLLFPRVGEEKTPAGVPICCVAGICFDQLASATPGWPNHAIRQFACPASDFDAGARLRATGAILQGIGSAATTGRGA